MPHQAVRNGTGFAYESLFLSDEEAVPVFVPLIQACFAISPLGEPALLEKQPQVNLAGEWWGDPATSSVKYETQMAFVKPATDVVLIGHAHAPRVSTTEMQVGIRVGPVRKVVTVLGDRYLVRRLGQVHRTAPEPFEKIPLIYERAFGGWDTRDPNSKVPHFEPRNPVGTGFRHGSIFSDDQLRLPNVEDVLHPYQSYSDTPTPAGFGFIPPHWQPRAAFAGTFDAEWDRERKPLLPRDFDRRFFNAASPGLIAPGYLKGDEQVVVLGASREGRVSFHLPGVPAPVCRVELRGRNRVELQTALDTVIIDMDEELLILIWRAHLAVRNGPHDVASVEISADVPISRPVVT